ncbi:arginine transporter permease subunit ArtM [Photobacterium aquae]|uniref:Arginine ABC transporter permease protein ArtM n=2 Tax=Photobacterium aquae TaxID=1195763 RepID=A0A0J1H182_9GAMM|nr:arginine transporter permease subunit ArtM [Photobacterium aquae]
MSDYIRELLNGLPITLSVTVVALIIGLALALLMTLILALKLPIAHSLTKLYLTLFTGTPLLVQIFLIYYGPGQFAIIRESALWPLFSSPWFCATLALTLNCAAYTTLLFHGALKRIPSGQWEACEALGFSQIQTLGILVPYALRRAFSAYSNEVIIVLKSSSLTSTITLLDITGYAQQLNAQTYDTLAVFGAAGILYLGMNGIIALVMLKIEHRILAFERTGSTA